METFSNSKFEYEYFLKKVREYKRKRSEDQQEKYCIVPFAFIYLLILETLCMLNQRDVSNRRFVKDDKYSFSVRNLDALCLPKTKFDLLNLRKKQPLVFISEIVIVTSSRSNY